MIPVLVLALLAVTLAVLHGEIAHLRYHDISAALSRIPMGRRAAALAATVLSYAMLPGYDVLALRYVDRALPLCRVAFASVASYGISQTLGFPAVTGGSVRARLWSAWGLDTAEIARAVAFAGATFSLGVLALVGLVGISESSAGLTRMHLPVGPFRILAATALILVALYFWWSVRRHGASVRVGSVSVTVPSPRMVVSQLVLAAVDWACAALVLYILLPTEHAASFPAFLAAFILAQTAGVVSHVPGGLGVFETLILLQVGGTVPADAMLASLIAYRAIFYLLPFVLAVGMLAGHELHRQRARLARATNAMSYGFGRWAEPLLPGAVGLLTIIGGAVLLFSGATPPVHGRLTAIVAILPLGTVELSHFAASVVGALLLVLGWALTRRLDAAYHLASILLVVGMVASLLKGLDWEEAVALGLVLALLRASRMAFYRRASLLSEPLTPGWFAAIAAIAAASVWIGLFSFKHVEYSAELWWRFTEDGDAPRFLRASAGAAVSLTLLSTLRLLRYAPPPLAPAAPETSARVQSLLPTIDESVAALALLGDKQIMLAERGDGFLMFGVNGRSWVVLGDPYGSDEARHELAWRLMESADAHGGWPVFYEVSSRHLPLYIDLGLTLLKLGEEAIVPLTDFSLEGGHRRGLRRTQRDLQRSGARLSVIPPERVPQLLPALREISDEWLQAKSTREKGFSLGRFEPEYLMHCPHAIVHVGDRIVAFANLWTGSGRELSVDLMRYRHNAPAGVMEYLFLELMLWGRREGFARFSLGMAPLSGLESRGLAPRWHRLGGVLYRHGEHFYNFQGLRRYKEKFDPVWEPRYLATPAGMALPRILTNVASLISGGITGLLVK